jgi:hypothetical protein
MFIDLNKKYLDGMKSRQLLTLFTLAPPTPLVSWLMSLPNENMPNKIYLKLFQLRFYKLLISQRDDQRKSKS